MAIRKNLRIPGDGVVASNQHDDSLVQTNTLQYSLPQTVANCIGYWQLFERWNLQWEGLWVQNRCSTEGNDMFHEAHSRNREHQVLSIYLG